MEIHLYALHVPNKVHIEFKSLLKLISTLKNFYSIHRA